MPDLTRRRIRRLRPVEPACSTPSTTPVPDPRRWRALLVVLTASFLGTLDFFIVNVSVPVIQGNLNATFAEIQLTIAFYGLTYAVCLITGGRLGDLYGRKRMFLIGLVGFTITSGLCGLAVSPNMLIVARIFQGMSGALMFPQVLSIIQVTFPAHERSAAFGIFGAVGGSASFVANLVGGPLVEANLLGLSWRPIFLVNLPLGVFAFFAARRLVRESRSAKARRLDLGGVALATLALMLLVYPLIMGRETGWPVWAFISLAACVPALVVFLVYERRVETSGGSPLVELSLFRDRVFVRGLLTTVAFYGGLSVFFLMVTLYLQKGLHLAPRDAGFVFAPFALGFLLSSTWAIKLAPYLGSRVINVGSVLMAVGLITLTVLAQPGHGGITGWHLLAPLLIYGIGQGFVMPTLVSTVLSNIPHHAAGSAAGVLTTVQQIAMSLGVAAIGSLYFSVLDGQPEGGGFADALTSALPINITLLLIAFGVALLLPRRLAVHGAAAAEV